MSSHAVEVRNLSVAYNGKQVLDDLEVQIPRGARVVVLGDNGAGKSTLLSVMTTTLLNLVSGNVKLFGTTVNKTTPQAVLCGLRRRIGLLPQSAVMELDDSCLGNVQSMATIRCVARSARRRQSQRALELVGLSRRAQDRACHLNGGDKRRLGLARTVVGLEKGVIFADEPTANLSRFAANEMLELFCRLNDDGHTIVVVTHDQDWARQFTADAWLLTGGKLGPTDLHRSDNGDCELFQLPEQVVYDFSPGAPEGSAFTTLVRNHDASVVDSGTQVLAGLTPGEGRFGPQITATTTRIWG